MPALVGGGAKVRVVDPQGRREGEALLPGVTWEDDPYAAAEGADALVILTEWNEFRALDLGRLAGVMAAPRMADLRNVYAPEAAREAGFSLRRRRPRRRDPRARGPHPPRLARRRVSPPHRAPAEARVAMA